MYHRNVRPRQWGVAAIVALAVVGSIQWTRSLPSGARLAPRPRASSGAVAAERAVTPSAPGAARLESPLAARGRTVNGARRNEELPGWAVAYGAEFWRGASADISLPNPRRGTLPGLDVSRAIDRVTHAFTVSPSEDAAQLEARTYRMRIEDTGVFISPSIPPRATASAPAMEVSLATRTLADAGRTYFDDQTAGTRAWTVLGNTAQSLLSEASGVVEHYEASARGVELTWIIPRPLHGTGPLTIEAGVSGAAAAQVVEGRVHLLDEAGVARLNAGPAVAVDAAGRRWDLAMAWAGDRLSVEVPSEALTQASYPLAIDPWISPEYGVDQPVLSDVPSTQAAPTVAANSQTTLVAWVHGKGESTPVSVYAARLSPAGQLLDPYGLAVGPAANEQILVSVAARETGFVVVWCGPKAAATTDEDIFAARVDAAGTVRVLPPVCNASGVQCSPCVAAGTTGCFIAWRDSRNTGIYGALLRDDNSLSATNGVALTTASNEQMFPAVASLGDGFLAVWQDYRKGSTTQLYADVFGTRISAAGEVQDPAGIAICTRTNTQWLPAVGANGANYLVVWEEYHPDGNDIYGARVSPDGVVLDTNGLTIATAPNSQLHPVVAGRQGEFLVVWQDYRLSKSSQFQADLYAARVADSGAVLDPEGLRLADATQDQGRPAVAAVADGYQVVWQDFRNHPDNMRSEIFAARLDARGQFVGESAPISRFPNYQATPAAAVNGDTCLVVWADDRQRATSGLDLYGARLNVQGQVLDPSGILISPAPGNQSSPAVAPCGNVFLVAWADLRNGTTADLYGARVDTSGKVLEPDALVISTAPYDQTSPAVAALGQRCLVVWQDARSSPTNAVRWDIYGARLDADGTLLDPGGLALTTATNDQTLPAVAANDQRWLVVWEDRRASQNPDIYGARVAPDGSLLDPNGLALCTASLSQTLPAVVGRQNEYLVAWTDARVSATGQDIYAARVDAEGVVLDPAGLAVRKAANQQSAPALAVVGDDYFVAWQEATSGTSNNFNLMGARVTAEGWVDAGLPTALNTNAFDQVAPALVQAGGGLLIFSQGFAQGGARTVAHRALWGPRLTDARVAAPGRFEFSLVGPVGQRYAVEASSDLVRWSPVATVTNRTGVEPLTVSNGPTSGSWFYRAQLLP